jgi:hypothetical protein
MEFMEQQQPASEAAPSPAVKRPTGITVLAVLAAIGGVFGLLGALALFGLSGLVAATGLSGLVMITAIMLLAYSVMSLAFAYGAWTLKPWAWPLGVAAMALSVVTTLIGLVGGTQEITGAVISLAIAGVILYYLFTPTVKAAFGRS